MLDISTILQYKFPTDQYLAKDCGAIKKQLVFHHTAGGPSPYAVFDYWKITPEKVATPFVIAGASPFAGQKPDIEKRTWADGTIMQGYSSKYVGYHLGIAKSDNKIEKKYMTAQHDTFLAERTIGIEICNWGFLTYKNGKFYNYTGKEVPEAEVIVYDTPYRGGKFYHKYTDAQVQSTKDLAIYLCDRYGIPKTYNENMWDIDYNLIKGNPGMGTHSSYKTTKADIHPQPNMITALKSMEL